MGTGSDNNPVSTTQTSAAASARRTSGSTRAT
ncbi:hypothetical protein P4203_04530 [Pseudomonas aeruginosa]|nr:hypothetical protein [Pseudomonas aeruginosa]